MISVSNSLHKRRIRYLRRVIAARATASVSFESLQALDPTLLVFFESQAHPWPPSSIDGTDIPMNVVGEFKSVSAADDKLIRTPFSRVSLAPSSGLSKLVAVH